MLACRTVIQAHNVRTHLLFLDRSMIKCKRHGQMRHTAVPSCPLNSIPEMEHTVSQPVAWKCRPQKPIQPGLAFQG